MNGLARPDGDDLVLVDGGGWGAGVLVGQRARIEGDWQAVREGLALLAVEVVRHASLAALPNSHGVLVVRQHLTLLGIDVPRC